MDINEYWNQFDKIEGFFSPTEGRVLSQLCYGKDVCEIGSFKGKSSSFIAVGCKSLFCVDIWEDEGAIDKFRENIKPFGKTVTYEEGRSIDVAKTVNKTFDIIFVDGSHEYQDVKNDIIYWIPHLRKNGRFVFHDFTESKGVYTAVIELLKDIVDMVIDSLLITFPTQYMGDVKNKHSI
jgi:predicted O-methyltransferase YrrM